MVTDDNIYNIGVRVDKDIWDYLHRYKYDGKMSTVVRDMLYDHMEHEDPERMIDEMVERLENDQYDPKQFMDRFTGMCRRYRENLAMYGSAVKKIEELEENGIMYQIAGRLRLKDNLGLVNYGFPME